jgi:hypothetical protein
VFTDGEEFDVGVAHVDDVADELVGELAVGEHVAVLVEEPGAEVDLVDGHGLFEPVGAGAAFHPVAVLPGVAVDGGDDGAGAGREFGEEGAGVGLHFAVAHVVGADEVFVDGAVGEAGDEEFPDAAGAEAHGVAAFVPAVEVAGDEDAFGGGGPDGEADAADAVDLGDVGAEHVVALVVGAFAVEVEVEFGEQEGEAVGVVVIEGGAVVVGDAEAVGAGVVGAFADVEAAGVDALHVEDAGGGEELGGGGLGEEGADLPGFNAAVVRDGVGTEHPEGVAVASADEGINFIWVHGS